MPVSGYLRQNATERMQLAERRAQQRAAEQAALQRAMQRAQQQAVLQRAEELRALQDRLQRAEEQRAEEQARFKGLIVWIEQSSANPASSGIAHIVVYNQEAYEKFSEIYNRIAARDRVRFLLNFFYYITGAEDEDVNMLLDRPWLLSMWPELGQQVPGRNGLIPYYIDVFDASFFDKLTVLLQEPAVEDAITDLGFVVT